MRGILVYEMYRRKKKKKKLLTADNFADSIKDGVWFVKFFAPWCGHCKKLAPTWDELSDKSTDVKIAHVDCTQHQAVCQDHGVRGYPTLLLFKNGGEGEKYQGQRDLSAFTSWLAKQTGAAAPAEEKKPVATEQDADSNVVVLGTDNFASEVEGKNYFVKFYAPWCGHCKKMIPTWEELAGNEDINVAKVDCTIHKELATEHEIRGFPTIFLFKSNVETMGVTFGSIIIYPHM